MRQFQLRLCLTMALLVGVPMAGAGMDFWVWHRNRPLGEDERQALAALGTSTLYWHVGVMENTTGQWKWKSPPQSPPTAPENLRVVPVVRLDNDIRLPFPPKALGPLLDDLERVAGPAGTLQMDYDCPDRLLPDYAVALRHIRTRVPHLSITALTNWPRLAGFSDLTNAIEEIAPMFYDLQADPTGVTAESPPPPLLDPAQIEPALQLWKSCRIPWRAGLPTFSRLTVFDRTGLLRGQIPRWTWDDLSFHKSLHTVARTRLGVTLLRADADGRVASTPVSAEELVASRFTDRAALRQSIAAVQAAGAAGVVLFRMPDGSGSGGWSLSDLADLSAASRPNLVLRQAEGERWALVNESPADLAPRLSGEKGDRDRGYALEIDAPVPVFREAMAGDFWRVTSHAQPEAKKPLAVVVPLATRLTFWFSHLRGRQSLQTGLLQLAPDADLALLRYRVLDGRAPGPWTPLAPQAPSTTSTP